MSVVTRMKSPALLSTLFFLLFAVLLFRVVWPADQVLQSADYNYGLMGMYKAELPEAFFEGFWRGAPLLGRAGHLPPTWTFLSLSLLPLNFFMDWIYAINLLIASGFLIAFLRLRGLNWLPAIGGALAAFWLGSNLTLLLPGHIEKYGVLVFASATLYCLEQTLQKASWRWSLLAGASLGWMFMHQADLALFFGLLLGAYWLLGLCTRMRGKWPKRVALHLPMLFMALLFSWHSYTYAMRTQVNNVEILQSGDSEAKWNFATQWSFPPDESLDLIAPGFWGWMTQDLNAPYHGRTGQSPEWTEELQGFPNFKSESVYLGMLPFLLALLAILRFRDRKKETLFWAMALLLTFLLACGKYTPLYALFFKLPLVNSIRNPNKFLQVFQVCLGILSAFGLQTLLEEGFSAFNRKRAGVILFFISLVAGAGSFIIQPENASQLEAFARSPWAQQAAGILRNRQLALLHLCLMSAAGGGLIMATNSVRFRKYTLAGFITLISADALLLSRIYLQPAQTRFIKENPLAEFLKKDLGEQRVYAVDTRGLYNLYLTHVFPYHQIAFANITAAPRLQSDYQQYFTENQNNLIKLLQEFGVKYVLAPRKIMQSPGLDQILKEVYSYDIAAHPRGGVRIAPNPQGQHVVLELLLPHERFALLPADMPAADLNQKRAGKVLHVLQKPSGFLVQVEVEKASALLRLSDYFDPNLRARIDDEAPLPLQKFDPLFASLEVPEGLHDIEFSLPPPGPGIFAQWAGLIITLLTAFSFILPRTRFPKSAPTP
ncbi:hypothetical protein P0Y35_18175 [Kiritimatiellaeota bacterium B1221]|nr:hypothetical protein [Kiritimatiellaeota bacterium B1221]